MMFRPFYSSAMTKSGFPGCSWGILVMDGSGGGSVEAP